MVRCEYGWFCFSILSFFSQTLVVDLLFAFHAIRSPSPYRIKRNYMRLSADIHTTYGMKL